MSSPNELEKLVLNLEEKINELVLELSRAQETIAVQEVKIAAFAELMGIEMTVRKEKISHTKQ